ncbi:MAG: hypothetical protein JSU65_12225 [Candidatus Zixiibacteriota bacterium]|nr:MAG: hypothetical protein JSU65_12225 [candidate division Zixibacteria bacterium]
MCIKYMTVALSVFLLLVVTATAQAVDPAVLFGKQHQAGVRIGAWANLGDLPLKEDSVGSSSFISDIGSGSFHFEAFAAYRISRLLVGELSVGIVNRGSVQLKYTDLGGTTSYFGNLILYPILVKLKAYPLRQGLGRLNPYLTGGGGISYARHDLFAASSESYFPGYLEEESAVSGSLVLGGGADWPLASVVGLDFQVQYIGVRFSNGMFETKDWTGLTVTVGVKYLFESKKKNKKDTERKRGEKGP